MILWEATYCPFEILRSVTPVRMTERPKVATVILSEEILNKIRDV